jgi:hypothetical protein
MDITRIMRDAFLDYYYGREFDIDHPTEVDMEQRLLQWARRHPNSPQNGGNSSVSSQNGVNASSYTSTKKKSNPMKEKNISSPTT